MLEKRPLYLLDSAEDEQYHEFSEACAENSQCLTCGCCEHGVEPQWGCHMKDAPEGVPCIPPCNCKGTGMTWKQNNDRMSQFVRGDHRPDGA